MHSECNVAEYNHEVKSRTMPFHEAKPSETEKPDFTEKLKKGNAFNICFMAHTYTDVTSSHLKCVYNKHKIDTETHPHHTLKILFKNF